MGNAERNDETDPLAFHTGDRLRKAREMRGMDRTQLANELGTTRKTVAAYEAWVSLKAPANQHCASGQWQPGFTTLAQDRGVPTR